MRIKELKARWESSKSLSPDCSDSEFAQKYVDKLIAVSKAAESLPDFLWWNYREEFEDLKKALDELSESKNK